MASLLLVVEDSIEALRAVYGRRTMIDNTDLQTNETFDSVSVGREKHTKRKHVIYPRVDNVSLDQIANEWNANVLVRAQELENCCDESFEQILVPELTSMLQKNVDGLDILDAGCGLGHLASRIQSLGYDVTGIDISQKSIEYARSRFSEVTFHVSSIAEYRQKSWQRFNAVMLNMVLHNVEDLKTTIEYVSDLLKYNGMMLASIPHPYEWVTTRPYLLEDFEYAEESAYKIPFKIRNGKPHPELVTYYHRPFSRYIDLIESVGLKVLAATPPCPRLNESSNDLLFIMAVKN